MKQRTLEGFGPRLAQIRKGRGLSQRALGKILGVSQRVIVYYEREDAQPPGSLLVELAQAMKISIDELLGVQPLKLVRSPSDARLLKRLQRIRELPKADQQAILKFLDALLDRHNGTSTKRPSRVSQNRARQVAAR